MVKKDSAVSVVIIFVMILAIFALVVALWGLLGVPGQVKEGQYMHALDLQNSFGNMEGTLEIMKNDDDAIAAWNNDTQQNISGQYYLPTEMKHITYSILLPVGMAYSVGNLQVKEKVGEFRSSGSNIITVSRLSVTFGEDSEIGLEGGGVFRRDGNSAHWVIMPHLKDIQNTGSSGTWDTCELSVPTFTKDSGISLSTNADAVVDVWYLGTSGNCGGIITYTALDEVWDAKLWQEFFFKAYEDTNTYLAYPHDGDDKMVRAKINSIINLNYGIRLK